MSHEEIGFDADLIDLGGLSLFDLKGLDDSVLAHALRRVLMETDVPATAVAAFQSYIDGPAMAAHTAPVGQPSLAILGHDLPVRDCPHHGPPLR